MILHGDRATSPEELADLREGWRARLPVQRGEPVALRADFSAEAVACLLALFDLGCVAVLLSPDSPDDLLALAGVTHCVDGSAPPGGPRPPLLERLAGEPGLVLFTSGSSGEPKAILHSVPRLLARFARPGRPWRTLSFLLFDHIGGLNTLFYTLSSGGTLVIPRERTVDGVCEAIQRHRVELLPTSPSFLRWLLLARAWERYDLSSLRRITYGTEPMPAATLERLVEAFPGVRFQQTYGLSELGILRSRSASDDSLWMQVGGEDYETRIVDGTLRIRARCSMLGYLNAADPFDEEGWLDTGDLAVAEGDWIRILGRQSEVINVGGQKVHPTEVERVLVDLPDVLDATVSGEPHEILGQIVVATVQMASPVGAVEMRRRVAAHCRGLLQPYMVPVKVRVVASPSVGPRFKKVRG